MCLLLLSIVGVVWFVEWRGGRWSPAQYAALSDRMDRALNTGVKTALIVFAALAALFVGVVLLCVQAALQT